MVEHLGHVAAGGGGRVQAEVDAARGDLADQLVVREDAEAVQQRVVLHALAAHLQPVGRRKVDRLGKVVALVDIV